MTIKKISENNYEVHHLGEVKTITNLADVSKAVAAIDAELQELEAVCCICGQPSHMTDSEGDDYCEDHSGHAVL